MKTKRLLLTISIIILGLFATASCSKHIHIFDEKYSYDSQAHWQESICEHTDIIQNYGLHEYGEWIIIKVASHTEDGSKKQICSVCGYENIVKIQALGHSFSTAWESDSTNHWHECSCGDKKDKAAHTYGEFEVIKEATDTQNGSKKQVCSVCGYENVVTIPATGHTFNAPIWTWDGCKGATAKFTCENNSSHVEEVSATISSKVTTPATCDDEGERTYTATVTFKGVTYTDTKTESIPAFGHSYGTISWAWDGYSSATAKFTCENNSSHTIEVPATITSEVTTPATCETTGVRTYTATVTFEGKTYTKEKTEEIPALGHSFTNYISNNDATSTQDGTKTAHCDHEGCNETNTITDEGTMLGHVYINPIWNWDGYETATLTFTCQTCGAELNHTETTNATITSEVTTPATCEGNGVRTYTATVIFAGETYTDTKTEEIPALGHSDGSLVWVWNEYESATAKFICGNDSSHIEEVSATITNEVTTNPTCETTGERTYTATVTFGGITYTDTKTEEIPALGHSDGSLVWVWNEYESATAKFICGNDSSHIEEVSATITNEVTTNPTCETTGERTYTATVTFGGITYTDKKTEEIPALGHSYGTISWIWDGYTAATAKFTCENNSSHIEEISATITNEVTTPATCEETGIRTYTATVTFGGITYTDTKTEEIPALGHSFTNYVSNNDATCTVDGTKSATCEHEGCNEIDTVVDIDSKLGHDLEHHDAKAPTCTKIGWNAYDTCSRCDYTTYVEIPANGHTYGNLVAAVPATCEKDGNVAYYHCSVCDKYFNENKEEIEAIVVPATGHTYGNLVAAVPATCEEDGNVAHYHCSVCDKYFNENKEEIDKIIVEALGHIFTNYISNNDATSTKNGTKTAICDREGCDAKDTIVDEGTMLGHTYGDPTWNWTGYESATASFKCQTCEVEKNHFENVKAIITSEITTPAKCEETGVRTYTAKVVFGGVEYTDTKTEELPVLGHSFTNYLSNNDATCTEDGTKTAICDHDGCSETDTLTDIDTKLGHSFTNYVSNGDATCTEDGTKSAACDYDGCSETDTITDVDSKIPHTWSDNVCTACGYDAGGSKGLSWTLDSETNSYTVTGYGACLDTELTIPKTYNGLPVTAIGSGAFKNQSTITNIIIPRGIVSIGSSAFEGCKGITSIVIPEGVTVISSGLFNNCKGLTEVILPEGITSIDEYAFYSCSALSEIAIPSTVKSYGTYAFYLCSSLLSITLPDGADSIPNYLFHNCYNLKEVDLPNSIKYIGTYAFSSTDIRNIELPNGLEEIDGYAFRSCDLESVVIPNSVTKIGSYAFSYCGELVEATLSNSIKNISTGIFSNCRKLMTVNLSDGIESISTAAFGNCFNLVNIILPSSLKVINACAFQYCSSLKTIVLPEGLVKIDAEAFKYCVSLKNINIPDNLIELGINVFLGANDLEYNVVDGAKYLGNIFCGVIDKTKSEYTINHTTKFILDHAFENCSNLVSISIPDSVLCIGSYAFKNCCSLKTIEFSKNIKTFSTGLLYDCSSLTTLEIPEGITIIQGNAIQNCTNLRSIIMPNSLEKLEYNAIYQCPSLTSVKIGSGLKYYNTGISQCNKLLEVYNGGTENLNGTYLGSPLCIYNSLDAERKLIKDENGYVFYKDDNENMFLVDYVGSENEIVLPTLAENKTYSIYKYAFSNYTRLTKLTIPSCVTEIQDNAFLNCYNLLEIKNESSLTITTGSTTNGSIGLYALYVNVEGSVFTVDENGFVFNTDSNGNIYLVDYLGNEANVTLPTLSDGKKYSIYQYAFYDNITIKNIIIPNCVTSIGAYAFYNCNMIESIVLPDNLTLIGDYAFSKCFSMKTLTFGSGELSIGNYAFFECGLTSLNIPNNIVSLGKFVFAECNSLTNISLDCETTGVSMFDKCTSLTDVIIENNVQKMSDSLFNNCTNLRNVTIGNSVTIINSNVFSYCYSLENIMIPDNVNKMYRNTFFWCIKLKHVTIGNGVSELSGQFPYCYCLKSIVIGSSVNKINSQEFQDSKYIENVYYYGTKEKFSNISIGKYNESIINATRYYYSETEPSLNEEGTAYDDDYWHYVDGKIVVWSKSEI